MKIWVCEFCGTQNEVDIVPEEIPTKEDTTFIISPAPVSQGVASGGAAGVEDALVVFCIDISGSMCVTTEVSICTVHLCVPFCYFVYIIYMYLGTWQVSIEGA